MASEIQESLKRARCWTRSTARIVEEQNLWPDCLLWNRPEFVALLEWMQAEELSSVLEVGCHRGQSLWYFDRLLQLDRLAASGYGSSEHWGHPLHLPAHCERFRGDLGDAGFDAWRERLGPIDLVIHHGHGSREQMQARYDQLRRFPTRYLAIHKISGRYPGAEGVKDFWDALDESQKERCWVLPNPEDGWEDSPLGIGLLRP